MCQIYCDCYARAVVRFHAVYIYTEHWHHIQNAILDFGIGRIKTKCILSLFSHFRLFFYSELKIYKRKYIGTRNSKHMYPAVIPSLSKSVRCHRSTSKCNAIWDAKELVIFCAAAFPFRPGDAKRESRILYIKGETIRHLCFCMFGVWLHQIIPEPKKHFCPILMLYHTYNNAYIHMDGRTIHYIIYITILKFCQKWLIFSRKWNY